MPNKPKEELTPYDLYFRSYIQEVVQSARLDRNDQLAYAVLARKMKSVGVTITGPVLNNKLLRGSFSFTFGLQVLSALEVKSLDIPSPETVRAKILEEAVEASSKPKEPRG